jgi:SAM-dependent methyltransferase
MHAEAIARLRRGQSIDDRTWDDLYPSWARAVSGVHWTPLAVARRATAWLVEEPGTRVLDVGSGVGKLCVVGALTTAGAFTGVEQEARLHEVAREVSRRVGARCRFVRGDAFALDWGDFDAFYFYNPFAEPVPEGDGSGGRREPPAIDAEPAARAERQAAHVAAVLERLDAARVGTRVVTYHGFGGSLPGGWEEVGKDRIRGGPLELWVKRA